MRTVSLSDTEGQHVLGEPQTRGMTGGISLTPGETRLPFILSVASAANGDEGAASPGSDRFVTDGRVAPDEDTLEGHEREMARLRKRREVVGPALVAPVVARRQRPPRDVDLRRLALPPDIRIAHLALPLGPSRAATPFSGSSRVSPGGRDRTAEQRPLQDP